MSGRFFLRVLFGLLVLIGIAGLGYYAYQMGLAQGAAQGAQAGAAAAAPYYWYPHPFFAPFWGLGCLIPLVLLLLVFGGMRAMFWRGRMMDREHWRERWHERWSERGVPPMVEEWHKRMHEQKTDGPDGPKPEGKAAKV